MQDKTNDIILEIAVLTYNHKDFIIDSLNSVLNQTTSYNYKIIILDDCSSDGSSGLIQSLANQYPDKIDYHVNDKNSGPVKSAIKLAGLLTAKYACFMDGDDYWCNELKIQNQIDFLENNEDFAGCFHDAKIEQINSSDDIDFLHRTQTYWKTYSQFNRYSGIFMPWALIQRNIIPTASLIFRNPGLLNFLENYKASELSLSWALHLEIIKNSKLKYFNEIWSVYNDHSEGISKKHKISTFKLNNILILESLLEDNYWKYYSADIYRSICTEYRFLLKSQEILSLEKPEFNRHLRKYKSYLKLMLKSDIKQLKEDHINVRNNGMVD